MEKLEVTYLQMVLVGLGVGVFLGLFPLIVGLVKKKPKLAVVGFFASVLAGGIWSMLAIIASALFVWLILKKPAANSNVGESNKETEVL